MNNYIKDFNQLIINCNFENTYKMAWAKAIIEICIENNSDDELVNITFDQISSKILKYYWNQTIYFNLIQGSNLSKIPEILTITKKLIDDYFNTFNTKFPERFEKIESKLNKNNLNKNISKISKVLKKDVCWRFLNLNNKKYDIYKLNKEEGNIELKLENVKAIKDYSDLLLQVVNYRWTQILENFNHSPRISSKVRAIDDNSIKRSNLSKFHEYLILEFEDQKKYCFYCGNIIPDDEISLDHIIPWSFMFSDDIWNLVFCHKSENSMKSNSIIEEKYIEKLEQRNRDLLSKMSKEKHGKKYEELEMAINNNYVRKFWIASKG